jgi:hypothetical protein
MKSSTLGDFFLGELQITHSISIMVKEIFDLLTRYCEL